MRADCQVNSTEDMVMGFLLQKHEFSGEVK